MRDFRQEDLEVLEGLVATTPAWEQPEFPSGFFTEQPAPEFPEGDAGSGFEASIPVGPSSGDIMTLPAFLETWHLMHDMGGGMISMRTGAPCPLGEQSRNEGGRVAGEACYHLLAGNPALSRLFLNTKSTFIGQLAAIGMHGFSCVQIIKASASGKFVEPEPEMDFKSSREGVQL